MQSILGSINWGLPLQSIRNANESVVAVSTISHRNHDEQQSYDNDSHNHTEPRLTSVARGNVSANQVSEAGNSVMNEHFLEYPRNFFHCKIGVGPKTAEQAARLWMYRKNRPRDGLADTESEPDGEAMLLEIKEIRDSLRMFICSTYMDGIRSRAKDLNLMIPGQSSFPTSLLDFRTILNKLESTMESQILAFELVRLFHKDRHWLSTAIDKWMLREKMFLTPIQKPKYVNGKRTRSCPTDRGGFSAVGRSAKSQIVASLMVPMLRNAGWSVALTKGQGKKNSYEHKVKYNEAQSFYVVVRTDKVITLCGVCY